MPIHSFGPVRSKRMFETLTIVYSTIARPFTDGFFDPVRNRCDFYHSPYPATVDEGLSRTKNRFQNR